jgi:hypothetical protein
MRPGRPVRAALAAGLLALSACMPAASEPPVAATPAPAATPRSEPAPSTATSPSGSRLATRMLAALPVKPRSTHAGYARDRFGSPWQDVDRNGCDTRDDILRRDLTSLRVGERGCVIEAGVLADPYTGGEIRFERGRGASVDIDHVVALSDAWSTGAAAWEQTTRIALANDPLNLLAVDAATNRAKGDGDAATWLPPNHAFRCAYVARQIAVKAKYGLWITADEHDAMAQVLAGCPDQLAPEADAPTPAPDAKPHHRAPHSEPSPKPQPAAPTSRVPAPNYGSCKEAKAHGAGPYHRDRDPEYHYYRDADGDGVVCE